MRTISQRELRNDNAAIVRAVEAGESFIVTKNGTPVAVVRPAAEADVPGLPLVRAGRPVDYRTWERLSSDVDSGEVLDDLRGDR